MIYWTVGVLAVYLIFVLAIGFYSGRGAGKNTETFFVANRQLNWVQESMAVMTTAMPGAALVGTIGLFYASGANMLGFVFGYAFFLPLTYWYIGSRLRRLGRVKGYQTQGLFIGDFYQSQYLRWGVTIAGIIFSIPIMMSQVVAVSFLLATYTGLPYPAGVLLFVVVSGVYTFKGGLRAVANTDVFHGAILLLFLLASLIVIVFHAGGLAATLDTPKAAISTSGPGMEIFFAWLFYVGLAPCVQPDRAFRMFAVRNESNYRKGAIISGAMIAFCSFCYLLIGLAVGKLSPALAHTDSTLVTGLGLAAAWLIPWFLMNAWGGSMSSFTAGMLSTSNIVIKDVFEPWYVRRGKTVSDNERNRMVIITSRVCIFVLALVSVAVAAYPPPFIWSLINVTVGGLLQFFPMFLLGFLWRRITSLGAAVGWTTGVIFMCLWTFVLKPPLGPLAGVDALIVNFIVTIVVSLLVPEAKEAKEAREAMRVLAISDVDSLPPFVSASPLA